MKKLVLKLSFNDDKSKQKAMVIVSGFSGVESLSMDKTDKKLTVVGDFDPVSVAIKLRKLCITEMVSVGPAKEETKKEEEKSKNPSALEVYPMPPHHYYYNNCVPNCYPVRIAEEYPNGSCVIS